MQGKVPGAAMGILYASSCADTVEGEVTAQGVRWRRLEALIDPQKAAVVLEILTLGS